MKAGIAITVLAIAVTGAGMAAEPVKTPEKSPTPVTSAAAKPAVGTASKAAPRPAESSRSADRLDLDATVVTGNRELPKVLYIVPWKKAELGDLPEQPFNTLLDEALTPIDRDEFRREVSYYSKLADRPAATGPTPAETTGAPVR